MPALPSFAAAAPTARAEGNAGSAGPTFANRTPMRIGTVTMRVASWMPSRISIAIVLGLNLMERTAAGAILGSDGVKLLVLEAIPQAPTNPAGQAGLYHTAFLMPTRKIWPAG